MKVLLINGSAAKVSHTAGLLAYMQKKLTQKGIEAETVDLTEVNLPTVVTAFHRDPSQTPNEKVKRFVRIIKESDAIVFSSPLYHGSYSGLLKNALDNLAADALKGKVVGLTSNAGGMRNTQALEHLRSVVRTMYGYVTQTQIGTSNEDFEETANGYILSDETMKKRCERFIDEMIMLTGAVQQIHKNL